MTDTTGKARADKPGSDVAKADSLAARRGRANGRVDQARSAAEIEAEIERTRAQLAGTIDEITERVHPRRVAQRGADRLKRTVVDGNGQPRVGRIAVAAAGVAALVALAVWRKRR